MSARSYYRNSTVKEPRNVAVRLSGAWWRWLPPFNRPVQFIQAPEWDRDLERYVALHSSVRVGPWLLSWRRAIPDTPTRPSRSVVRGLRLLTGGTS